MMSFIEREAVMEKFADYVERSNNSDFAPKPTWTRAVLIVEDYPAADVRPVVRGKWIKIKYRSICRDCSFRGFASWNFCPNCGADMREEK